MNHRPLCQRSSASSVGDGWLEKAADRRSVRKFVRLDCEVVRERDFRRVGTRALDLSTSGLRVVGDASAVLTGEPVILTFRAPGSDTWIDAEGTVARVVHGRRAEDYGPSVGVQFRALDPDLTTLLRKQLLKCPPPMPRRAARVDYAATVRRISRM